MRGVFTCPVCRRASSSIDDAVNLYCGDCKRYTGVCGAGRQIRAAREGWDYPCPDLATEAMDVTDDADTEQVIGFCRPHFTELTQLLSGMTRRRARHARD